MKKQTNIIILCIFAILIFSGIAYVFQQYLMPLLPKQLQTTIWLIIGSFIGTVAILSGLVQIIGINLKDIFQSKEELDKNITSSAGILISQNQGKIEFKGDIFQSGSTQVVLNTKPTQSNTNEIEIIEKLIAEIQKNLHEDNKLSYVLTLCNDLCDLTNLSGKYNKWLNLELVNHVDVEKFKQEFKDDNEFNIWLNNWASYRLIETYLKWGYRSTETGRYEIDTLPFKKVIIGYSVSEVINILQSTRRDNISEISAPLQALSQEYLSELQLMVNKLPTKLEIPPDVKVFFQVSELRKILVGIRQNVLTLLTDVRKNNKSN